MAILREPRDIRVAVDGDGVVRGFGSCGPSRGERDFPGEVFTLYVAPDWQNRGVGRQLLIALFRRLVASGLAAGIVWVLRDNPSRYFYERTGGFPIAERRERLWGCLLDEIAYGWPDLTSALDRLGSCETG